MSAKKPENLVLRVDLDPELTNLFHQLKKDRNFRTNAEAIRYCITETSTRKEISIPSEMAKEIKHLLSNTRVLEKYQIYDQIDLVKRALETYILKIKKETGTLFTWSIRQKLSDIENMVAITIVELQANSKGEGVQQEEISQKTQLPSSQIENILTKFEKEGFVYKYQREGKVFLYAPSPEDYEL